MSFTTVYTPTFVTLWMHGLSFGDRLIQRPRQGYGTAPSHPLLAHAIKWVYRPVPNSLPPCTICPWLASSVHGTFVAIFLTVAVKAYMELQPGPVYEPLF